MYVCVNECISQQKTKIPTNITTPCHNPKGQPLATTPCHKPLSQTLVTNPCHNPFVTNTCHHPLVTNPCHHPLVTNPLVTMGYLTGLPHRVSPQGSVGACGGGSERLILTSVPNSLWVINNSSQLFKTSLTPTPNMSQYL